ncbi:MAG: septum formation initiator family protein [Micropruina sp.]|nr:MAG: septum formation initiator family protein [Micropruina sp.]
MRNVRLPKLPNRLGLTRRALVVISMVVLLALSYANSLRIYVGQQNDLAVAQQQIRERSDRIAQLQDELRRWEDPAYVKAQARERLGWVVPGETGSGCSVPTASPSGAG